MDGPIGTILVVKGKPFIQQLKRNQSDVQHQTICCTSII